MIGSPPWLALVGAWLLATNLPCLARLAVEVLRNAEGSRRAALGPEFIERAVFDALGVLFSCVAGWLLFREAANIATWWEAGSPGDSESS